MREGFDLLEEKVRKAADLLRRLRKDKESLEAELANARSHLQDAEKQLHALQKHKPAGADADHLTREVKTLRQEREEVRNRIAKLVDLLESLD